MIKPQKRIIRAIVILLMLGVSPLSVTYSYAEIEDNQDGKDFPIVSKNNKKEGLGIILTEKVVNRKVEVRHYVLPDDLSVENTRRTLSFDGQTPEWAYVNYKAYHSGIVLFDGKAPKSGENLLNSSSNVIMILGEKEFDHELSGKFSSSHIVMNESVSDEDLSYRIIFSGKTAEIDEENVFAIFFINSGLKNTEVGQNIKSLQIGELNINSEKSIG